MMLCSTNNELCCSLFPLKLDSARLYCQRNPHKSKHLFTQFVYIQPILHRVLLK